MIQKLDKSKHQQVVSQELDVLKKG